MPKAPMQDDTTVVDEAPVMTPVSDDIPEPVPPCAGVELAAPMDTPVATLDDAFYTLGQALLPLLEDNMPAYTHVQECLGIYSDGNQHAAWQRVVAVLEGVLGTPLLGR